MEQPKKLSLPEYILAAIFFTVICIISAQVVFRYVFNNSLTWTEELSRYLFIWLVFLGAAIAVRDRVHIRVDLFVERLPKPVARIIDSMNMLLIVLFLEVLFVIGVRLVVRTTGATSPALGAPVNIVYYAALPVTFLLAAFYAVRNLVRDIREFNQPASDEEAE